MIFSVLILIVTSLNAQKYDEYWAMQKMWASGDSDFEITIVPNKWKGESVVILCESYFQEFKKQSMGGSVNADVYIRKRVKLLDKAAVNEYSVFTFDDLGGRFGSRDSEFFGIKIIKPDGKVKIINLEDAVQMGKFRNSQETRKAGGAYNKIALNGLEIGDIIDLYYISINTIPMAFSPETKRFDFEPVIQILPEEYPIVKGSIGFLPERRCYINICVSNGAPDPELRIIEDKNYYVVEYEDLEKIESELWVSPYNQFPAVRFQVIIAPPNVSEHEKQFISEPELMKTTVSEEDLFRSLKVLANQFPRAKSELANNGITYAFSDRNRTDSAFFVEDLFYFYRHFLQFSSILYYGRYVNSHLLYDNFDFAQGYSRVLKKKNIDHSVFLAVPKSIGNLNDVIFLGEMYAGIKLELNGETIYLFDPSLHSVFGEIPAVLQGVPAIMMDVNHSDEAQLYYDTIPLLPYEINYQNDITHVSIDSLLDGKIGIKYLSMSGGESKNRFSDIVLFPGQYYIDEYDLYTQIYQVDAKKKEEILETLEYIEENEHELYTSQISNVEDYINFTYGVEDVEVDTLITKRLGRSGQEAEIEFEMHLNTSQLLISSGDYLILSAGKLIGRNIDLNDEEKERDIDIYMPSSRVFKSTIIIDIPKGYTPKNLKDFEVSVNNTTGGFIASAAANDKKVIIKTEKYYLTDYEPVSNWPLMLEFLEAANDFVQKKLVFKKISKRVPLPLSIN